MKCVLKWVLQAVLEGYCDELDIRHQRLKVHKWLSIYTWWWVVSWKSSKQMCIVRSTMESEFIALDKAGEEAEWLRHFLEDIPM